MLLGSSISIAPTIADACTTTLFAIGLPDLATLPGITRFQCVVDRYTFLYMLHIALLISIGSTHHALLC